MTRVAVLVLVTGCGRVAFDSVPGDALPPDAVGLDARVCVTVDPFDEDGDGFNDSCDPCPHLSTGGDVDSDNDGVGDACDPEPSNPRQRLTWFDGFNSELPQWNNTDPIVGGQKVVDVANGASNSILMIPGSNFILEIAGDILAVGPLPNQLFIAAQPAPNDSWYVELIDDGSGQRRSLMHGVDTNYEELDGVRDTGPIAPGPFRMQLRIEPDRMSAICTLADVATLVGLGTPPVDSMRAVFYANQLSLVVDYAVWIETL